MADRDFEAYEEIYALSRESFMSKSIHFKTVLRGLIMPCAFTLTMAFTAADVVNAQSTEWINPRGGDFDDGSNWRFGAPPTHNDVAVFKLDAASMFSLTTKKRLPPFHRASAL
jgi:hypothetical protein